MAAENYTIQERNHGGTVWVAIRARGAEYSWLTPEEAAVIGRQWAARYEEDNLRQRGPVLPDHA